MGTSQTVSIAKTSSTYPFTNQTSSYSSTLKAWNLKWLPIYLPSQLLLKETVPLVKSLIFISSDSVLIVVEMFVRIALPTIQPWKHFGTTNYVTWKWPLMVDQVLSLSIAIVWSTTHSLTDSVSNVIHLFANLASWKTLTMATSGNRWKKWPHIFVPT